MWIDVQQNTENWFQLRVGKITSSNFSKIMANEDKAFGDPAKKYAQKVALEIVTQKRDGTDSFKNAYMDRGNDLEPVARELYEIETFCEVTNGGFNVNGKFGDSPDGNVGKKGCIEIKCVVANTHWERLKRGGFDTSYKWQIHGHIWLGEKQWCDYVSYCPEMPESKRLYIYRVERDEDMIARLETRLNDFCELIEENIKILEL
jgi:hypothetical protein